MPAASPITPPREAGSCSGDRHHGRAGAQQLERDEDGTYKDLTQLDDTRLAPLDPDGGLVTSAVGSDVVVGDPSPWLVNQPWGKTRLTLFISNSMKKPRPCTIGSRWFLPLANAVAGEARFLADRFHGSNCRSGSGAPPRWFQIAGAVTVDTVALFKIPFDDEDTKDREIWLAGQPRRHGMPAGSGTADTCFPLRSLMKMVSFWKRRNFEPEMVEGDRDERRTHRRDSAAPELVHLFWIDSRPGCQHCRPSQGRKPMHRGVPVFQRPATTTFRRDSMHIIPEENSTSLLPGTPDRSFLWYYTLWTWRV